MSNIATAPNGAPAPTSPYQTPAHVEVDKYAQDCVRIEPLAIEEEYVRLPSDLAYWNARYAEVYRYWQERKQITEQTYRVLSQQYREHLTTTGKGKVTLAEVEDCVQLDDNYKQAKAKELSAEVEKIRIAGVCEAIRAKKDMLVSLGAHMRAEMGGDLTLRTKSALEEQRNDPFRKG